LKTSPFANPQQIAQLEQWGRQLQVAVYSRQILAQAQDFIIKKANMRKPVDPDLTADHALIVQSVRSAGAKASVDPPPNLGKMSDRELREYTSQFGFWRMDEAIEVEAADDATTVAGVVADIVASYGPAVESELDRELRRFDEQADEHGERLQHEAAVRSRKGMGSLGQSIRRSALTSP
jgi:hypothetical protein